MTWAGAAREVARELLSLPDPSRGLEDMLQGLRQLPDRGRIDFLKLILREMIRLRPYSQNCVETPDGLSDGELSGIAARFSNHLGRRGVLRSVQNPTLIGGVRVTIGDRRWDRSINGFLKAFVE
jgi:F0F1-type ATP synthase delta subunit